MEERKELWKIVVPISKLIPNAEAIQSLKHNEQIKFVELSPRKDTITDVCRIYLSDNIVKNMGFNRNVSFRYMEKNGKRYGTIDYTNDPETPNVKFIETYFKYTLKGYGRQVAAEELPPGKTLLHLSSRCRSGRYGSDLYILIAEPIKEEDLFVIS